MNNISQFLTLGKKARGLDGQDILFSKPVDLIIIHWIGPYPNQSVFSPWYWWEDGPDGKGVQASAHYIVKDIDVLEALPLNIVGWHSGDERNYHSIGIEVVPMNTNGQFSNHTIETLRDVIYSIRDIYPMAQLTRHYDGIQKKDCPLFYTPFSKDVGINEKQREVRGDERWIHLRNFLDGVTNTY